MGKVRRIIDSRKKEKFMIDDEYLNGYAKLCGIHATGVYISLCRHTNKNQDCFPSEKLIAKELSISIKSVQRAIKMLIDWNIIDVIRKRRRGGTWRSNTYILLDKSVWKTKPSQEPNSPMKKNTFPGDCESLAQGTCGDIKETNIEGNTFSVY